ncbi:MAG: hypothetical protein FWH20_08730 [Oscillospiraceae bacterium]|nr:hypothetical protein [Oscillospiraceae bacterium]
MKKRISTILLALVFVLGTVPAVTAGGGDPTQEAFSLFYDYNDAAELSGGYLQDAGGPTIAFVPDEGLLISDRGETWHAVDLLLGELPSGRYLVSVEFESVVPMIFNIGYADEPYTDIVFSGDETTSETLNVIIDVINGHIPVLDNDGNWQFQNRLRLNNDTTDDYYIKSIRVGKDFDQNQDELDKFMAFNNLPITDYMRTAGDPTVEFVAGRGLKISDRVNNWDSVDFIISGLEDGIYALDVAFESETQTKGYIVSYADEPWSGIASSDSGYTTTDTITANFVVENGRIRSGGNTLQNRLRLNAASDWENPDILNDYFVTSINFRKVFHTVLSSAQNFTIRYDEFNQGNAGDWHVNEISFIDYAVENGSYFFNFEVLKIDSENATDEVLADEIGWSPMFVLDKNYDNWNAVGAGGPSWGRYGFNFVLSSATMGFPFDELGALNFRLGPGGDMDDKVLQDEWVTVTISYTLDVYTDDCICGLIACLDCNPVYICGVDGYICGLRICTICAPVCGINGYLCGLLACSDCNPEMICGVGGYECGLLTCSLCNPEMICGVGGYECNLLTCSLCNPTMICGVGGYECNLLTCSLCNPTMICGTDGFICGLRGCTVCAPVCGINGHLCGLITCESCITTHNNSKVCGVSGYECGLRICTVCAPVCGVGSYECGLVACPDCNPNPIPDVCGEDGYECGLRNCTVCAPVCGVDGHVCGLLTCATCNPIIKDCGTDGFLCGLIACPKCNPVKICGEGGYECGLIACTTNCNPVRICGENGYECRSVDCETCFSNKQPPKTGLGDYRGLAAVAIALTGTSAGLWVYSRRRKIGGGI